MGESKQNLLQAQKMKKGWRQIMALTRNFKETVVERINREPAFEKVLLDEASKLLLNGEAGSTRLILRDLLNLTTGVSELCKNPNLEIET